MTPGIRWPHIAGATGVFVLGLAAILGALDLGYWDRGPGPGFFPLWMGILLAALAAVWGWQLRSANEAPMEDEVSEGGWRQVSLVLGSLVGFVLVLDVVGFQIGMTLFVLFIVRIVGQRRWRDAVIMGLVAGFGVYALFANVLQVYLPTSSIAFLANAGL